MNNENTKEVILVNSGLVEIEFVKGSLTLKEWYNKLKDKNITSIRGDRPLCAYKCRDGDNCTSKKPGLICTLPKDHKGQHIACGYVTHCYSIWN